MKPLFLILLVAFTATAQPKIVVPPEVWSHYQSLGTNLAAQDAKLYDLRTSYLAEVKAGGQLVKLGRLTGWEYQSKVKEIQARFDTDKAPLEKVARALSEKRNKIATLYRIPQAKTNALSVSPPKPSSPRR